MLWCRKKLGCTHCSGRRWRPEQWVQSIFSDVTTLFVAYLDTTKHQNLMRLRGPIPNVHVKKHMSRPMLTSLKAYRGSNALGWFSNSRCTLVCYLSYCFCYCRPPRELLPTWWTSSFFTTAAATFSISRFSSLLEFPFSTTETQHCIIHPTHAKASLHWELTPSQSGKCYNAALKLTQFGATLLHWITDINIQQWFVVGKKIYTDLHFTFWDLELIHLRRFGIKLI